MPDEFDLDATLFMAVRRASDVDSPSRAYLEGVLIEPRPEGGAFLVATDGWSMLVGLDATAKAPRAAVVRITLPEQPPTAYDEDGDPLPWRPWRDSRLQFAFDPDGDPVVAGFHWRGASIPHTHLLAEDIVPAKVYPDWRKVMTTGPTHDQPVRGTHLGLCPATLRRLAGDEHALRIEPPDTEGKPYRLRFERGDLTGVIMPRWMTLAEDTVGPAVAALAATAETSGAS